MAIRVLTRIAIQYISMKKAISDYRDGFFYTITIDFAGANDWPTQKGSYYSGVFPPFGPSGRGPLGCPSRGGF